MSPSALASLIEQRLGFEFDETAFPAMATIEGGVERIRELRPEAEPISKESILETLAACPGWRSRPPSDDTALAAYLPLTETPAFWQALRVRAGVDRWPTLEAVPLMSLWQVGVIAFIPPLVFFGALALTDELVLATLIGALNAAYLVAFCMQRRRETRPRPRPADLSLADLAEQVQKRRRELAALPAAIRTTESPERLAEALREESD